MIEFSNVLKNELLQSAKLNVEQIVDEDIFIIDFKDLVSRTPEDVGRTKLTQHRIDTGHHPPLKQHPRKFICYAGGCG